MTAETAFFGHGEVYWTAVSALATAAATIVALASVIAALWLPGRVRRREIKEAVAEILTATEECLSIRQDVISLLQEEKWEEDQMAQLRVRADHVALTLDRLISRPNLTDGVIATGAGARTIARALADTPTARELRRRTPPRDFTQQITARYITARPDIEEAIMATDAVVLVVSERAEGVSRYHKSSWSKIKERIFER